MLETIIILVALNILLCGGMFYFMAKKSEMEWEHWSQENYDKRKKVRAKDGK